MLVSRVDLCSLYGLNENRRKRNQWEKLTTAMKTTWITFDMMLRKCLSNMLAIMLLVVHKTLKPLMQTRINEK